MTKGGGEIEEAAAEGTTAKAAWRQQQLQWRRVVSEAGISYIVRTLPAPHSSFVMAWRSTTLHEKIHGPEDEKQNNDKLTVPLSGDDRHRGPRVRGEARQGQPAASPESECIIMIIEDSLPLDRTMGVHEEMTNGVLRLEEMAATSRTTASCAPPTS
jgi:hypothetical protein